MWSRRRAQFASNTPPLSHYSASNIPPRCILQSSLPQTLRHSHTTIQFASNTPPLAYYNTLCFKHSATRLLQYSFPQTLRHSHTTIQFAPNTPPLEYYNPVCLKHSSTRILQYSLPQTLRLSHTTFTGLVLLTLFLQDMLSLALPCILIIFSKAISFSKLPMHC